MKGVDTVPIAVNCDFCNKPLELEDGRYILYRTKKINTRKIYPYLCKDCAKRLDDFFEVCESRKGTRIEIIERYHKLNQERREKLGTKG